MLQSQAMKILLAVHHFPPRYTGGAEWRAARTARALQGRGHQVRLVCVESISTGQTPGVTWVDDVFDGIPLRRLSFNLALASDRDRWEYDNPWIGEHLRALIEAEKPQLFHLFGGYLLSGSALLAAQSAGLPTVVSLTDFWWMCRRIQMVRSDGERSVFPLDPARCARCLAEEQRRYRLPGKLFPGLADRFWRLQTTAVQRVQARHAFLRAALNQADAIISPSQFVREAYISFGIQPGRIVYSRQGRDFPDLKVSLSSPPIPQSSNPSFHIGYVGQLIPIKGVHVLVEAVRRLPELDLRLSLYGDPLPAPAYTARLKRLARGDRRIRFAGVFKREEVSRVQSELDVLVVPSLWYENSPNVILEALAHRTPVVVSELGGMAELIEHGKNGLRFAPGDAGDLAAQLQRLMHEPDLLPRLRSGIEPVKSVAQEMDELISLYRRLPGGGSSTLA